MGIPRYSVIVPTYHEEAALEGTLVSIGNAGSGHSIETIIVDGGSTDRTLEIARRHTGNIHVLDRRGIGAARNHGARHAMGEILVFLDSDTRVPPDFFDQLEEVFHNPAISGANCNVMPSPHSRPRRKERTFYRAWGRARRTFYKIRPCGTGDNGIIVRRSAFRRAGGFDESMSTMEDLDFVFRASRHGRFVFLSNLTLRESMRRIRGTGILKFSTIYIYNFLYYLVKRKPRISKWEPVR